MWLQHAHPLHEYGIHHQPTQFTCYAISGIRSHTLSHNVALVYTPMLLVYRRVSMPSAHTLSTWMASANTLPVYHRVWHPLIHSILMPLGYHRIWLTRMPLLYHRVWHPLTQSNTHALSTLEYSLQFLSKLFAFKKPFGHCSPQTAGLQIYHTSLR